MLALASSGVLQRTFASLRREAWGHLWDGAVLAGIATSAAVTGVRWPWVAVVALASAWALDQGRANLRIARRMRTHDARQVLADRSRRFILYLRNFDRGQGIQHWRLRADDMFGMPLLNRIAPVITLAEPSLSGARVLPLELAAAFPGLLIETEDAWRATVLDLMRRAALVVIRWADDTAGVAWELANAFEVVAPNRLAVLVPPAGSEEERARRYEALGLALGRVLRSPIPGRPSSSSLVEILIFDDDWNPRFVPDRSILPMLDRAGLSRTASRPGSSLWAALAREVFILTVSLTSWWSVCRRLELPAGLFVLGAACAIGICARNVHREVRRQRGTLEP